MSAENQAARRLGFESADTPLASELGVRAAAYLAVNLTLLKNAKEIDSLTEENLKLKKLAETDNLTGLPNERGLKQSFENLRDSGKPFAMVQADIKRFKKVNDDYGMEVGNQYICYTAHFLGHITRHDDTIAARRGGDEFSLLVSLAGRKDRDLSPQTRLLAVMERVKTGYSISEPIRLYNSTVAEPDRLGLKVMGAIYKPGMELAELLLASEVKGYKIKAESETSVEIKAIPKPVQDSIDSIRELI